MADFMERQMKREREKTSKTKGLPFTVHSHIVWSDPKNADEK